MLFISYSHISSSFCICITKKITFGWNKYVCHLDSLIKHYGLIMGSLLGHGLIIFEIGYLLTNISKLSFSKGQIFLSLVNNLLIHTYMCFFFSLVKEKEKYIYVLFILCHCIAR